MTFYYNKNVYLSCTVFWHAPIGHVYKEKLRNEMMKKNKHKLKTEKTRHAFLKSQITWNEHDAVQQSRPLTSTNQQLTETESVSR